MRIVGLFKIVGRPLDFLRSVVCIRLYPVCRSNIAAHTCGGGYVFVTVVEILVAGGLEIVTENIDANVSKIVFHDACRCKDIMALGIVGFKYQTRQSAEFPRPFGDRDFRGEPRRLSSATKISEGELAFIA